MHGRPDYKKLGVLRQLFPEVPIIALTATATERVRADLCSILRVSGCETFHSSVDRHNLFYEVCQLPIKVGDGQSLYVCSPLSTAPISCAKFIHFQTQRGMDCGCLARGF